MAQNPPSRSSVRLLVVHFTGNHSVAYETLSSGADETYYAQRYAIEALGRIGRGIEQLGVLCCCSNEVADVICADGVRSMASTVSPSSTDYSTAICQIEKFEPTHLIIGTPALSLLRWALSHHVKLLPMFADSFYYSLKNLTLPRRWMRIVRREMQKRSLVKALNDPRIEWVANHNVNASRLLVSMGVDPRKVIPWDYESPATPAQFEPKRLDGDAAWRIIFVGSVIPEKGVGDAIEAVRLLVKKGHNVDLRLFGRGQIEMFEQQTSEKGIAERVHLEGFKPRSQVLDAMRSAHLVLVPSWHEYSEASPFTIYESLITRTPLVCSDHPMFVGRVGSDRSALVVPEQNPTELARAIERILDDPQLYASMSRATATTWDSLQCPVKYEPLILHWIGETDTDRAWLAYHALPSAQSGPSTVLY